MNLVSFEEDIINRREELMHMLAAAPEGHVTRDDFRAHALTLQTAYEQLLRTIQLALDPRAGLADRVLRLQAELTLERAHKDALAAELDSLRIRSASPGPDAELRLLRSERDKLLATNKDLLEVVSRYEKLLDEERAKTVRKRMYEGVPRARPRKRH